MIKLTEDGKSYPEMKGSGITSSFTLHEGEVATFVLREPVKEEGTECPALVAGRPDELLNDTQEWWNSSVVLFFFSL